MNLGAHDGLTIYIQIPDSEVNKVRKCPAHISMFQDLKGGPTDTNPLAV